MNLTLQQRMIEGSKHYAAGETSDPFVLTRAMLHIRRGIAGLRMEANREYQRDIGEDAFYKATPGVEERVTPDNQKYFATVYYNRQRP